VRGCTSAEPRGVQNPEASACSAPRRLPLGSKSKEHHVAENGYAINESGYPHIFLNCNRAQRHVEENNYFTEMCSGSEAGSYLRLTDFAISLNSRLESNKEEEEWICDQRVDIRISSSTATGLMSSSTATGLMAGPTSISLVRSHRTRRKKRNG